MKPDLDKVDRSLQAAWEAACEVEQGNETGSLNTLAIAVQELVLAVRELIEPEEAP